MNLKSMISGIQSSMKESKQAVDVITGNAEVQVNASNDMKEKIDAISQVIEQISQNIQKLTDSEELLNELNGEVDKLVTELVDISKESDEALTEG